MPQILTPAMAGASSAEGSSLRRVVLLIALVIVLAAASLILGRRLDKQQANDEERARITGGVAVTSDFGVFRHAGERFWLGEPLYRAGRKPAAAGERQNRGDGSMGFKYGPLFAMAFSPIAALPGRAPPAVWSCINLLSTLGLGWLLSRWVRRYLVLRQDAAGADPAWPDLHPPAWWGWAGLLATLFFIQLNWVYGQTNLVFLFFLLSGLELYATGRPVTGGLLAGLVAGMRLTPLVFLPYFLYKRQWRAGAGMVAGLVLSFALPMAWWGPQEFKRQMQDWRSLIAADDSLGALPEDLDEVHAAATAAQPVARGAATAGEEEVEPFYLRPVRYQSIQPMVLDTFALAPPQNPQWKPAAWEGYRNFLSGALSHDAATALAYGLAAVFCLVCAGLCWRNYPPGDLRHLLEWALVLTAMVLVSPYSERTHYAALAPALTLLIARALAALSLPADRSGWRENGAGGVGGAVGWAIGLVLFFNLLTPPLVRGELYDWFKAFHGNVLGGMVLFGVMAAWLIREHRRAGKSAEGQNYQTNP